MSLNIKAAEFIPDSKSSFEAYVHNTFNEMKSEIEHLRASLANSKKKLKIVSKNHSEKLKKLKILSKNHNEKFSALRDRIHEITPDCEKCRGSGQYRYSYIGDCGNTVNDYRDCDCEKLVNQLDFIIGYD